MKCGRFATFFTSFVTQRKIFMILPLSHATNSPENFLYFFIDKAYALMYSMFLLRNTTEVNKCASGSAVEHHLAKVGAAGSIPVSRSQNKRTSNRMSFLFCECETGKANPRGGSHSQLSAFRQSSPASVFDVSEQAVSRWENGTNAYKLFDTCKKYQFALKKTLRNPW